MASFMATGRSITRCPTGAVAESTTSSRSSETGCYADFTLPIGPEPDPDPDDQQHLLCRRRSAEAQVTRPGNRRRDRTCPARRIDADPGTAGPRLETAQVGVLPSDRKRLPPGEPAGRRSIVSMPGSRLACRSAHDPTGISSSSILTVPRRGTRESFSASPWSRSIMTWRDMPRAIRISISIMSPLARCTTWSERPRPAGRDQSTGSRLMSSMWECSTLALSRVHFAVMAAQR